MEEPETGLDAEEDNDEEESPSAKRVRVKLEKDDAAALGLSGEAM